MCFNCRIVHWVLLIVFCSIYYSIFIRNVFLMPIRWIRIVIPVVILSIGIIYYYINPSETGWMPKCPWWLLTDTYCPSCGIQRFLHLLLTGHFIEALCMNPFLMISLPYATLAVLGKWYNINGVFNRLNRFIYSRKVLLVYIILFFIWWGIRIVFGV